MDGKAEAKSKNSDAIIPSLRKSTIAVHQPATISVSNVAKHLWKKENAL
jgi:hypothetical protein